MEISDLFLPLSTFVVIILLYLAVNSLLSTRRDERNVLNRAAKWSDRAKSQQDPDSPDQDKKKSLISGIWKLFKKPAADARISYYANTPLFYQRAGIYDRKTIRSYQALRLLLFFAPIGGLILSYYLYQQPLDWLTMLVALLAVCVGYYLPVVWLRLVAHYRRKDLYKTFPDAIDLLMVCVEAGLGVDAAIRRVSREIHITSPELAKEFKILSLELKTGKSRNDCLKNLALRTDLSDVDNLVRLMIQAEKYGTGVANALRVHAEEMRQKRYSRLEELAAKLPVKLTVPMILFIFPAFFFVIVGPAAIQVFRVIIQR